MRQYTRVAECLGDSKRVLLAFFVQVLVCSLDAAQRRSIQNTCREDDDNQHLMFFPG